MSDAMESTPLIEPVAHRPVVIQRLLDAGLSPATLASMLPELRDVIAQLSPPGALDNVRPLAAAS